VAPSNWVGPHMEEKKEITKMRCPDCSKFVSFGEGEVEVQSEELDDDGTATLEVSLTLPCGDCGTELKGTTFDVELNFEAEHQCEVTTDVTEGPLFKDLEVGDVEADQRTQTTHYNKKKKAQVPSSPRYWVNYYGVSGSASATCCGCGEVITLEFKDEARGSSIEELV
jgi:hypothetical protein